MMAMRPIMHDFCMVKISPETSFTGAVHVTGISKSLSSSTVGVILVLDGTGLAPFLTRLGTERAGDSEFECGGVLALHFRGRLNFQIVNFVMFWGRKRETVKGACVL